MASKNADAFRLGLVGAGRMGTTHLRALADSDDVCVVAVAEPVAALRDAAVGAHSLLGYDSVTAMLDHADLDGVLIVTPSDSHIEVIATVAEAGLAILCEKPCGVTPEDTRQARSLVMANVVPLQIAYWRRFVPGLVTLRERIAAGELGEILSIMCLQWDGAPPSSAFRARSGGIFVDMGVHEFDQARWLTGADFTSLTAAASGVITDPSANDDPDAAQVLATLGDATAFISLGRHFAGGDMASVEVFGTRGHVAHTFLDPTEGERAQLAALRLQASAFAEYARGAECLGASVDDAIKALTAAHISAVQVAEAVPQ